MKETSICLEQVIILNIFIKRHKRKEMERFEKSFELVLNKVGTSNIKDFAQAMYAAGEAETLDTCLKDMWNTGTGALKLLDFIRPFMVNEQTKVNAADISINTTLTMDGITYVNRISSVTFPADKKKSFNERAKEVAENILASTPVYDMEDLLAKAVLAGYNMRKEDFGCKE